MSAAALIMAAGRGSRMRAGSNKAFLPLGGSDLLTRSILAFAGIGDISVIAVAAARGEQERCSIALERGLEGVQGKRSLVFEGGDTRRRSVLNSLRGLRHHLEDDDIVLIHDAARTLVGQDVIKKVLGAAQSHEAALAAMPVVDTVWSVSGGFVSGLVPREGLFLAATPQAARFGLLLSAHERAEAEGAELSDDAGTLFTAGIPSAIVECPRSNFKITLPEDLEMARVLCGQYRIGQGYDVHRLVENRALVLGGVTIPYDLGLEGHSDADVLAHAVMDALLGAAKLRDIGYHFPDNSGEFKGISSMRLMERCGLMLRERGCAICNIDATIVAQAPRLSPYIERMEQNIAAALEVSAAKINVKATTTERLGFEGRGEGISAQAVALISP